jgi:predicted glycosyltransferase
MFFEPLIKTLRKEGFTFYVTARPCQHTLELLNHKGIGHQVVGKFHGKRKFTKACGLLSRSLLLWWHMAKRGVTFSMSHGSPFCSIASKLLGIRNVWTLDGDKAPDVIRPSVKFASKIAIPQVVPKRNYVQMGADPNKIVQYPGFKEELYLWNFKANPDYLAEAGVPKGKPVVLVRPEASEAFYVHAKGFTPSLVDELKASYQIVLLPRTQLQRSFYQSKFGDEIYVPHEPLDGPNVVANSDLVISAGGTMNREAAMLGKKVVSTYREDLLTVDKWLIDNGFMLHNPRPTRRFVDSVVDGNGETRGYKPCSGTFNFFADLMRETLFD